MTKHTTLINISNHMNKTLKDLEKLINLKSPAQVAVWLGYKDTRSIHQWLQRGVIPKARVDRVKELLYKQLKKG